MKQHTTVRWEFEFTTYPGLWTVHGEELIFKPRGPQEPVDAWAARKRFVALDHDTNSLLQFLNDSGSWDLGSRFSVEMFWSWQRIISRASSRDLASKRWGRGLDHDKLRRARFLPTMDVALESLTAHFVNGHTH